MKYNRQQFLKKSLSLWLGLFRGANPCDREGEDAPSVGSMAHDFHPFFHDQLKDTLLDGKEQGSEAELLTAAGRRMMEERPLFEADQSSGTARKGKPRRDLE